jgi:hypothetical protein
MEDYLGAHKARIADVEVLLAAMSKRSTAAAHLGGVAVECRLKDLVLKYHDIAAWGDASRRAKDPLHNNPIPRPGHGLVGSLRLMKMLYARALADHLFLQHLGRINHPMGATASDFIDLRYSGEEINAMACGEWKRSLEYVVGWLDKNGRGIV